MKNIKLLTNHMKLFRHEVFITSFCAFLTSLILLSVLIFIFGLDVSAEEISGYDNSTGTDIPWSYDSDNIDSINNIYNFSYDGPYLNFNDSGLPNESFDNKYYRNLYVNFSSYSYNQNIPTSWVYDGQTYYITDFPYFVILSNVFNSSQLFIIVSNDNNFSVAEIPFFKTNECLISSPDAFVFPLGGNMFIGKTHASSDTISMSNNNISEVVLSENYYVYSSNGVNYGKPILSNSNIPFTLAHIHNENGVNQFIEESPVEVNYLLNSLINDGVFNDPNNNGSSENANNNLVIGGSDWIFKNSKYSAPYNSNINTGDIYPSGSVTFSFEPNQYQLDHSDEFYLTFTFYMDYSVTYKNWNAANDPFQSTNSLLNNTKTYTHVYDYNVDGVSYIDVPLSEFISSGNSKSWTWKEIFDKLDNFSSVLLRSKEITEISYNKFNLYCTAFINSDNKSSGYYTEWYNPMSKKGLTTDTSGNINKDPYNGDNNNDPDSSNSPTDINAPGEGGNNGNTSGSSNSSTGSIVINNNPTFNNNSSNNNNLTGDSGNTFNNLVQSMVGDNNITSDNIAETTGTNGFIQFMNNTFGFVPNSFYLALLGFFTTTLAILIVAFVVRLILDIL